MPLLTSGICNLHVACISIHLHMQRWMADDWSDDVRIYMYIYILYI